MWLRRAPQHRSCVPLRTGQACFKPTPCLQPLTVSKAGMITGASTTINPKSQHAQVEEKTSSGDRVRGKVRFIGASKDSFPKALLEVHIGPYIWEWHKTKRSLTSLFPGACGAGYLQAYTGNVCHCSNGRHASLSNTEPREAVNQLQILQLDRADMR